MEITLTPKSLRALVLLRYRATTVGLALNKFFKTYQYDQGDSLELCRFEAMSLVTTIAEYNTTMPEHVSSTLDYVTLIRTLLQYLDDWMSVSSDIVKDIRQTNPQHLSPTGRQLIKLYAIVMTPPKELQGKLPSKISSNPIHEPLSYPQVILNWFLDCMKWVSQIKSDIEAALLRGIIVHDPFLSEAIYPLLVFLLGPSTRYMHWFLYFWRRHSTLIPRTDFHQTVATSYMIPSLSSYRSSRDDYNRRVTEKRRFNGFWEASYYSVRGAWGSKETYNVLSQLLRQNHEVGLKRVMARQLYSLRQFSLPTNSSSCNRISEIGDDDYFHNQSDCIKTACPYLSNEGTRFLQGSSNAIAKSSNSSSKPKSKRRMVEQPRRKSCPHCPHLKPFTLRKDLDRHMLSIHSDVKFYCPVITCSRFQGRKPFNRIDNRDRHMKQSHGHELVTKYSVGR